MRLVTIMAAIDGFQLLKANCKTTNTTLFSRSLCSSIAIHRPPQAHPDVNRHLDLLLAAVEQVLVELHHALLENHDDRRAAELEIAELVPLLDDAARLLPLLVDPTQG